MPRQILTTRSIASDLHQFLLVLEDDGSVSQYNEDRDSFQATIQPLTKRATRDEKDFDGRELTDMELSDLIVPLGDFNEQQALFRQGEYKVPFEIPATHDGMYCFSDLYQTPILNIVIAEGCVSEIIPFNWSIEDLHAYHDKYLAGAKFPEGYVCPIVVPVLEDVIEQALEPRGIIHRLLGDELYDFTMGTPTAESSFLVSRLVGSVHGFAALTDRKGNQDRTFEGIAETVHAAPSANGYDVVSFRLRHQLETERPARDHEATLSDALSRNLALLKPAIGTLYGVDVPVRVEPPSVTHGISGAHKIVFADR